MQPDLVVGVYIYICICILDYSRAQSAAEVYSDRTAAWWWVPCGCPVAALYSTRAVSNLRVCGAHPNPALVRVMYPLRFEPGPDVVVYGDIRLHFDGNYSNDFMLIRTTLTGPNGLSVCHRHMHPRNTPARTVQELWKQIAADTTEADVDFVKMFGIEISDLQLRTLCVNAAKATTAHLD